MSSKQAFGTAAVFDEVGNGADFEVVFFGEFHQFGHTRHGAVVVDDFTQMTAAGIRPFILCQVNAGFGVSGGTSTPPFGRAVGKMWPGWTMSSGLADGETAVLNGQGAVGGGNAGGDAVGGFDGDG